MRPTSPPLFSHLTRVNSVRCSAQTRPGIGDRHIACVLRARPSVCVCVSISRGCGPFDLLFHCVFLETISTHTHMHTRAHMQTPFRNVLVQVAGWRRMASCVCDAYVWKLLCSALFSMFSDHPSTFLHVCACVCVCVRNTNSDKNVRVQRKLAVIMINEWDWTRDHASLCVSRCARPDFPQHGLHCKPFSKIDYQYAPPRAGLALGPRCQAKTRNVFQPNSFAYEFRMR